MLFPGHGNSTVEFDNYKYCHLISEIGLNHNGSIDLAKDLIKKSVLHGTTYIKLQKRNPYELSTSKFLSKTFDKCPPFGSSQIQVRDRLEFEKKQYIELKNYAESLGALLFTSVFDISSLKWALDCKVPIIKIASHSNTNYPLLNEVSKEKLPVIMSTGAASLEEIDVAVKILENNPLALMHCISAYPTPSKLSSLQTIPFLYKRYKIPVGFSSHETGINQSIAACALGACMIERHVTLSKSMEGLDHRISIDFNQLSELRIALHEVQASNFVKKDIYEEEKNTRENYHVGVYATRDIQKNQNLVYGENVELKQPAGSPNDFLSGLSIKDDLIALNEIIKGDHIKKSQVQKA